MAVLLVTYVTVGSHGFYYRETLSHRDDLRCGPPAHAHVDPTEDTTATAGSLDLVDSSSERLIQQLNERANMLNPAWMLKVAAAISLSGLRFACSARDPRAAGAYERRAYLCRKKRFLAVWYTKCRQT